MTELSLAAPEMTLLGLACAVLVLDLFVREDQRVFTYYLSQISLLVCAWVTMHMQLGETRIGYDGSYISDAFGGVLKISIFLLMALVYSYSRGYLEDRGLHKGEFYTLSLFAVLGMCVMISAGNMLTVYMGLELLSLCLYALVALDRDHQQGSEAAVKYFVLGAIASGILLYGMSLVYGATGSLDIAFIRAEVIGGEYNKTVLMFGVALMLIGVAFKFGAVPFHMWVPDVYQGARTPITMLVGSAPKVAAFAMAMRLIVGGFEPIQVDWQNILVGVAILSIGIGNVVALMQTNLKRLFAYSTISHVGFILLALSAGGRDGHAAAMFYAITYALTATGTFGILIYLSRKGHEVENLEDLSGLNEHRAWLALLMLGFMMSMAGVPLTVGFHAKWLVIKSLLDVNMTAIAVAAVLFSVVGAFYYLRVLKYVYFEKPVMEMSSVSTMDFRILLGVNGLIILGFGLFPESLIRICFFTV